MKCCRACAILLAALLLAAAVRAADAAPSLATAQGIIDKVEKDSLTVRPRGAGGKFEKSLVLKLTGTSKISTLTFQTRGGKSVPVQKDTDAKDLSAKQMIAVLYTLGADGPVLLTAVVLPSDK